MAGPIWPESSQLLPLTFVADNTLLTQIVLLTDSLTRNLMLVLLSEFEDHIIHNYRENHTHNTWTHVHTHMYTHTYLSIYPGAVTKEHNIDNCRQA